MGRNLVSDIIERYEADTGMLIPMLQDLQSERGYLPEEDLRSIAGGLRIPLTRVFGIARFYASFRLTPRGRHEITLCTGTVCHLKGAPEIAKAIAERYGVKPGGTTEDRMFTLLAVNCLGCCAVAPVMMVDGVYHGELTASSALKVIEELAASETQEKKP